MAPDHSGANTQSLVLFSRHTKLVMRVFNQLFHKIKIFTLVLALAGAGMLSFGLYDNDFEISKNLDIFVTLFKEINLLYVDDTNPGELMKTGIDAMLGSLDPYTNYIPEADIEDFRFMTTGQYGGIGAGIREMNGKITVAEPYEGFPAQRAGVMAGDVIVEVNGQSTEGRNSDEMSRILKGQPNTAVKVVFERPATNERFEKNLVREVIKVSDVPYFGMVSEKVGYIKLDKFSETAAREVRAAYQELLTEHKMDKLVLDLRGNGGGLLREAVSIVNMFVNKNQVVVETKGKRKDSEKTYRALDNPIDLEIPLVILINGGSASASEIVAGALQDVDRAVLVGTESYGKGLVQQTLKLEYNSQLKVTVAKYYIPSGRCIQRLDYSHRDTDGEVSAFPDSLKTAYKTKNGRQVFDGTGLFPDLEVKNELLANVTAALIQKNLIFDYATLYRHKHESLDAIEDWLISDKDYTEFVEFLKDKDYDYSTQSERLLNRLEKVAKSEKYYEDAAKEYESLRKKIVRNKTEDLEHFKTEIKELLSNEIVSRYHFAEGRIQHTLSMDKEIAKAIEVLENQETYNAILDGNSPPATKED